MDMGCPRVIHSLYGTLQSMVRCTRTTTSTWIMLFGKY